MSINTFYKEQKINNLSKYGKSLLFENGDITINTSTKSPVIVDSFDNVKQTIERAILTGKGTNIFQPEIGTDYKKIFQDLRGIHGDLKNKLVAVEIYKAISNSTNYINFVNDIKVEVSKEDGRSLNVFVFLTINDTSITVKTNLSL